jgi:hypothetical protein
MKQRNRVIPNHFIELRSAIREEAAKDVEKFLASGGVIHKAAHGETGMPKGVTKRMATAQQAGLTKMNGGDE